MLILSYPYYISIKNKELILIWFSNENGEDVFYKYENNLFIANNKKQIEKKIKEINFKIDWKGTNVKINLDKFPETLQLIKNNQYIDENICTEVNDVWNFFDDLYKTFSNESIKFQRTNDILDKAYHKFFHGMNLQAVTPKNESYHPVFSKKEITQLNTLMKNFMSFAEEKLLAGSTIQPM